MWRGSKQADQPSAVENSQPCLTEPECNTWEAPPTQQALQWLWASIFYFQTVLIYFSSGQCSRRLRRRSSRRAWAAENWVTPPVKVYLCVHNSPQGISHKRWWKMLLSEHCKVPFSRSFSMLEGFKFCRLTDCRSLWFIVLWHTCCFLNSVFLWQMSVSTSVWLQLTHQE